MKAFNAEALARLKDRGEANSENGEFGVRRPIESEDPDDREDPDDSARLSVTLKEPVDKIYVLPPPSPLPSEMPSSWWTPLHFGKPGDAVSPQDARLALALIEARLAEGHDSGHSIKRSLEANVSVGNDLPTTVGALHDRIYELYDSHGWFAFQQLYHEAVGLHPKRRKTVEATNVIPKGDAAPLNCDAIESGLAAAVLQMPRRVQRFLLAPPRYPPPWRSAGPPAGADDGSWCG
jgi:hypothetical protein